MVPDKDEFSCAGDGLYPDLSSHCRGYYRCSGDRLWRYNCPAGLKFDVSIGSCNWELLVNYNCNSEDTVVESSTISPTSSDIPTLFTDSTTLSTAETELTSQSTASVTSSSAPPLVAPVVIDQSEEDVEDENDAVSTMGHDSFLCPGDGLFPDIESDFTGYFRCVGQQVDIKEKF